MGFLSRRGSPNWRLPPRLRKGISFQVSGPNPHRSHVGSPVALVWCNINEGINPKWPARVYRHAQHCPRVIEHFGCRAWVYGENWVMASPHGAFERFLRIFVNELYLFSLHNFNDLTRIKIWCRMECRNTPPTPQRKMSFSEIAPGK